MISKEILLSCSDCGKILRILSFIGGHSILYSWKYPTSLNLKSLTFVRLYNTISNEDKVMLICRGNAEIVHSSLSADQQVIAVTILYQPEHVSTNEKVFEVVTGSDVTLHQAHEVEDTRPIISHESSSIIEEPLDEKIIPENESSASLNYHKGVYKSYFAQTYPSGWYMRFSGQSFSDERQLSKFVTNDEKLLQKPIFTCFQLSRVAGDINLCEYEVILSTHKHHIELFSFVLQRESVSATQKNLEVAGKKFTLQTDCHNSRMYGKPDSEVVAEKVVWSQWDDFMQRLYCIVPSHTHKTPVKKKLGTFSLTCVQFFSESTSQQVFKVELELDISPDSAKSPSGDHFDLDPTVSSKDLNMRICFFHDSGLLCLCWQEHPSMDVATRWDYNILVLNKDVRVYHRCPRKEQASSSISFMALGQYLLVHNPGFYLHIYEVATLSGDSNQMRTGLYNLMLDESHYPHLVGTSLEYIMPNLLDGCGSLDGSWKSSDSFDSVTPPSLSQASICFDRVSKSIFSLVFDPDEFRKMFFNKKLTLQNRVFLTRQAVWASDRDEPMSQCLVEVVRFIGKDPTERNVTVILAQLLIAFAYMNLLDLKLSVPTLLLGLFPVTIPSSTLDKTISIKEAERGQSYFDSCDVRFTIKAQIEKFVTDLLSQARFPETFSSDGRSGIGHGSLTTSWIRSMNACEAGSFTEYNLDCIRDQLSNLETSYVHPGIVTGKRPSIPSLVFQKRLMTKLQSSSPGNGYSSRDELLQSLNKYPQTSLAFLNDFETDQKSENLLVLTYTKLCDHLLAHCKVGEVSDLREMARNYVHAQIQATHYTLTLILRKFGDGNLDRPLYIRASSAEQNLLYALNQFQLVCEITCFPLPNGFQTFITCLTFRSLLARNAYSPDASSLSTEAIYHFSECLFDFVDRKLVQLTDEFVRRMLEDLGDRSVFSIIVERVLRRTRSLDEDDLRRFDGLLRWRSIKAEHHMARAYLKELYKCGEENSSPPAGSIRSCSMSHPAQSGCEQSVPALLKEMKEHPGRRRESDPCDDRILNIRESSKYGFPPFDAFLDFVRRAEKDFHRVAVAPLIDSHESKIGDLIETSVIQQIG